MIRFRSLHPLKFLWNGVSGNWCVQANALCPMCRGPVAENELVEVPPDYERQRSDNSGDTQQPWYSSTKVSLPSFFLLLLLYFMAHQHKAAGMEIKLSKNNDHDGVSHGVECSQEGDRIPPLKSNRQALEQEHRLSWVLRDCSDASTNFLDQLCSRLVPGTGSFNCHWQKDVRGHTLESCSLLSPTLLVKNLGRREKIENWFLLHF